MYYVGGTLLNEIKSIYVTRLDCVRVIDDNNECFRIDRVVRKGCILSPWFFNVYMKALM